MPHFFQTLLKLPELLFGVGILQKTGASDSQVAGLDGQSVDILTDSLHERENPAANRTDIGPGTFAMLHQFDSY